MESDRDLVREMGWRFADACNLRDAEAFRDLWLPDGVWRIGEPKPFVGRGHGEIVGAFEHLLSLWEYFVQLPHAPVVRVTGDEAESRWTMAEEARSTDGKVGYSNLGYYADRLVRTADGWRYAERSYTYLFLDEEAGPGKAFPRPDLRALARRPA